MRQLFTRYKTIQDTDLTNLGLSTTFYLGKGWEPFGSLLYVATSSLYIQPLVYKIDDIGEGSSGSPET